VTEVLSVGVIAAIAAGGAVVIAALAAGIVSIITAWRAIATKVSAIEGHVNSEKTAAEGRIDNLRNENALLREMIVDRKQTASLLAQSVATAARPAPLDPTNALPPTGAQLEAIAKSTDAIDRNTR
jgi:hypothetical protein